MSLHLGLPLILRLHVGLIDAKFTGRTVFDAKFTCRTIFDAKFTGRSV